MESQIPDEKLELRLGPPTTQVEEDQPNSLIHGKFSAIQGQKRVAPPSVVGWPPVRSFRKKMAASSSNLKPPLPPPGPQSKGEDKGDLKMVNDSRSQSVDQQFVKINMDGIPIGRKVDLSKYDNYQSLSSSVDHLFRGLLAAQEGSWAANQAIEDEDKKDITRILDKSGAYTLVYEDNEGDRVLVGDVPWNMFLSSVKRLRVLKSFEVGAKHG